MMFAKLSSYCSYPTLSSRKPKKHSLLAKATAIAIFASCLSFTAHAEQPLEQPLLIVGASWANGNLPLDDEFNGVWGGLNVGLGSYLDLGQALIKDPRLPGYVINEAIAGASTVGHHDCSLEGGTVCGPAYWISYDTQFERALRRVAVPGFEGVYNAKYTLITPGNDCLHSNNDDIPGVSTSPCTTSEVEAYIDRMIALGQKVLNKGMTPIYIGYPASDEVDLVMPRPGFNWFIDAATWEYMAASYHQRIATELSGAVLLDVWHNFEHNGDGIHPTDKTSRKAAAVIADYIITHP